MRANDGTGQRGHPHPQHVWIRAGSSAGRSPGLLLEWRQVDGRWDGYVIHADGGGNVKPRAYFEWLPADQIEPRT